jgi:phosphosulfolactate synthase
VNLGNVPLDEVLALETLRLGLRADTAVDWRDGP